GSANRRDNGGRTRRGPGGSVGTVFVEIDGIGYPNIVTERKSGRLQKRGKMGLFTEVADAQLAVVVNDHVRGPVDSHSLGAGVVDDGLIGDGVDESSAEKFRRQAVALDICI